MFEFKRIWDEKRRREEKGEETYRRDAPLPTKQFDGGPDNCADLLHPSRQVTVVFERLQSPAEHMIVSIVEYNRNNLFQAGI
jgi:hypothetical protein